MQIKKKCQDCGGAFIMNIPSSLFEREEHLIMKCPYCGLQLSMMIEDGKLLAESDTSSYIRQLPGKQIPTKPWVELIRKG